MNEDDETRTCPKCGETKPLKPKHFRTRPPQIEDIPKSLRLEKTCRDCDSKGEENG